MSKNVNMIRFFLLFLLGMSHLAYSQNSMQAIVDDLLTTADAYLEQDQLRTPADANAYDRYKAVLMLDSSNTRAQAGLDAIVRRYLALARATAERGRLSQAREFIANAERVGGKTQQTQRALAAIGQLRATTPKSKPQKPAPIVAKADVSDNTQFELDKTALSNRDRVMVAQLQSLGLRVKDTREYVLIHARSDAEGRWIYQQMRNASKGYRLRGDIRRSKTPKVILQPPLD